MNQISEPDSWLDPLLELGEIDTKSEPMKLGGRASQFRATSDIMYTVLETVIARCRYCKYFGHDIRHALESADSRGIK